MEYGLFLVAKRTPCAIFFRLSQVPISCGFLDLDFADLFSMRVAAERGRAVRALAAFAPPRNAPRSTATRSRAIGRSGMTNISTEFRFLGRQRSMFWHRHPCTDGHGRAIVARQ